MQKKNDVFPIELAVHPLEKNSFAPFGDIIFADPARMRFINNGTTKRYHDLCQVEIYGKAASILINIFRGTGFSLPLDITMVERHPYGSQAFFPLDQRPFLVVVAQDNNDAPQTPQAFLAQPGQGINYRSNTWHHPLLALDKTTDFLVMDRKGPENNLEEYFYDTTYRISNFNCYRRVIRNQWKNGQ
ncbi:MAG: ureidoglycolate lyase [Candidatus Tokpelaia sp. JSC188]|nr:MAG: ureidoglycolate lyase [Candidatus Tokpelaia sp. JSC188]